MIGENFFRHDIGRETAANRESIGGHGSPCFGVSFIAVGADGHHVAVDDIAAGNAEPAADGLENDDQVRIQTTVASHENTQIIAQGRFARGIKPGDFADFIKIQLTGLDSGAGVKIRKIRLHLIKTGCVAGQVILVFPAFRKDDGDHRLEQQGVRAGADAQMDIGDFSGFGQAGIDHDQRFIRVFGEALELTRSLGNLVALHAVPAECQKNIGVIDIRLIMKVLFAMRASAYPEGAGKLLGQGAVLVLRAEAPHQPDTEGNLKMAALTASAHVSKGTRAVLADNAFELGCNFINGLIPGNPFKFISDFFQRDISGGRHCADDRQRSCPCGRNSPRFLDWTCRVSL